MNNLHVGSWPNAMVGTVSQGTLSAHALAVEATGSHFFAPPFECVPALFYPCVCVCVPRVFSLKCDANRYRNGLCGF